MARNALVFAFFIFFIITPPSFLTPEGFTSEPLTQLNASEKSWIEKGHTVRVRIGTAPPFMVLADGKIQGIAIEYLTHIFNRNGIKFKYVMESEATWPAALKYIEQHEVVDMVPTAKITEERKKHMIFTEEYIVAPWVIFTRSTSPDFISSIEDLNGKTVSVEEGFVIHEKLKTQYPKIKLKVIPSSENYFEIPIRDLSTGLVDAYIGNLLTTTYMIQTRNYTNIKVAAPTPFGNHNQAMAMRDDWPELAQIINKTLDAMTPEEHAGIRNKWLSMRYEYGLNWMDILKWGIGICIIVFLIFLTILIWNKRLAREVKERKTSEAKLIRSEDRFSKAFTAMPDAITISRLGDGKIIDINDAYETMFGRSRKDVLGHTSIEIGLWPDPDIRKEIADKTAGDGFLRDYECQFVHSSGRLVDVSMSIELLKIENRPHIISITRDITEHKKIEKQIKDSLKEKETLLYEIHHRVKNNLAVVSSLLGLQAMHLEDQNLKDILTDSQNRIHAMATIHETLHQSDNLSSIDMKKYLLNLALNIFKNYTIEGRVKLNIEAENILMGSKQATPVGMLINELISNSLKYGFPDNQNGKINVSLRNVSKDGETEGKTDEKTDADQIKLIYTDDGIGIPDTVDWEQAESLGLQLVKTIAEDQLDGTIQLESTNGTCFIINFKLI
jgi:PAS domain S-box-containing protein